MDQLSGQWLGQFSGTNSGFALLDLDREKEFLDGMFYAFDADPDQPSSCGPIFLEAGTNSINVDVRPNPIHPYECRFLNSDEFGDFPEKLSIQLSVEDDLLKGTWSSDIGTKGDLELHRSRADAPSDYQSVKGTLSWSEFQAEVGRLATSPYRYVFRGQAEPWRLRTSFHRTHRKDLWKYWNDDIPRVRHASIGVVEHMYDPNIPDHNGAFMHLLQHHGYPTPMLDWTYSPYIAAFFAFSSSSETSEQRPLRIFMFDAEQWKLDRASVLNITLCRPHFSILEPLALGNPRALPQQSIAAITNLDDVESYIQFTEKQIGKQYLQVFDLDPSERSEALRQLGLMGISPGSMFPGIDGVCREYRDRHFGY